MVENYLIVRHGHTLTGKRLSEKGRGQMIQLGITMRDGLNLHGRQTAIFYAPSPRGEESSEVLEAFLPHTRIIRVKELWTGMDKPQGLESSVISADIRIQSMEIRRSNYIIIGDEETTSNYPAYITNAIMKQRLPFEELKHGEAYWLNQHIMVWERLPDGKQIYVPRTILVKP